MLEITEFDYAVVTAIYSAPACWFSFCLVSGWKKMLSLTSLLQCGNLVRVPAHDERWSIVLNCYKCGNNSSKQIIYKSRHLQRLRTNSMVCAGDNAFSFFHVITCAAWEVCNISALCVLRSDAGCSFLFTYLTPMFILLMKCRPKHHLDGYEYIAKNFFSS